VEVERPAFLTQVPDRGDWSAHIPGRYTLDTLQGKVKVNQSLYRPEVPRGFQEVKVHRLRDNGP